MSGKRLRTLWKDLGHEFSEEAWGKISNDYQVQKLRCQNCGFAFFDPTLAGNEAFYRQLSHGEYFAAARPEFLRTLNFARRKQLKRVLDVGCGTGGFLDLARRMGMETSGLELNTAVAEQARAKGHRILSCLLHELDRESYSGGFDLITMFQVLEHVPGPVQIMKDAAKVLNPGGYISIAVPSEQGICRLVEYDPYQWPPHHVSRWRLKDFAQMARAVGLELVECGGDYLLGTDFEHIWRIRDRLAPLRGEIPRRQPPQWLRAAGFVYRKTGMKFIFPRLGISIYGYFGRSESECTQAL